jgi:hypothetical protein
VIGVIVRVKHGVHTIDACGNELEAQLRRGIYEKADAFVCLHERADSASPVTRIG